MKKALIVGIDFYENHSRLIGCVNDSNSVKSVLERNGEGSKNFEVKQLVSLSESHKITKDELKDKIEELFQDDLEIALFYFSGHGFVDDTGSYLVTSECRRGDQGLPMNDIFSFARKSGSHNKIIVLDCCFSGAAGNVNILGGASVLEEGTTILTASGPNQYAIGSSLGGVFTNLFVDALNGSAANLLGHITPGSVYAHIDQSLGAWQQRPVFKTNVSSFTILRTVKAHIELADLIKLKVFFKDKNEEFKLNPSYEPTSSTSILENTHTFRILQMYNRLNLVVPVGEEHMYYAAMNSKSCKLTLLGQHYWNLIKQNRI